MSGDLAGAAGSASG
ncbi:hypothetical protein ABZ896_17055 [Streptomyces sp. NPDC047072]